MNSAVRMLLCFIGLSALVAGILALQPMWLSSMGLDVWALPELQQQLQLEMDRHDQMDRRSILIAHRLTGKNEAIGDLLAGRITFKEAVARFQELNAQTEGAGDYLQLVYPSASQNHSLCEQVLVWADSQLHHDSHPDKAAIRARLGDEACDFLLTQ